VNIFSDILETEHDTQYKEGFLRIAFCRESRLRVKSINETVRMITLRIFAVSMNVERRSEGFGDWELVWILRKPTFSSFSKPCERSESEAEAYSDVHGRRIVDSVLQ
jgi:hypothetical protein